MTENLPEVVQVRKKRQQYLPTVEKPQHRLMYAFYKQLGPERSFHRVAKEFGKSVPYVSLLSRAFGWVARVRSEEATVTDPIVDATKVQVDQVRTQLVTIVQDITDTLHEMSELSKSIKAGGTDVLQEDGVLSPATNRRMGELGNALNVYGIQLKDPKAFKDLLAILKDVTRFNEDHKPTVVEAEQPKHLTQINAPGAQLILRDD